MFNFLKRLVLYVILTVIGYSKRTELVKKLTKKTRKRNYINDIECIPAILDDITDLPDDCRDTISFAGFDKDGVCARFVIERDSSGNKKATVDLDLPGFGIFRYDQSSTGQLARSSYCDNICDGFKLKLFCKKGMQRWKVFLRAPLKHMNSDGKRLQATISLYWACLFDPFDHFASPSCWIRANNLTWLPWRDIFSNSWKEDTVRYEQFGELRGRIAIENQEEQIIRLKCVKERCFTIGDASAYEKVFSEHIVIEETGLTISNSFFKLPNNVIKSFGCVSYPVGDTVPIRTKIQDIKDLAQIKSLLSATHSFSDRETFNAINKLQKSCFNDNPRNCMFITGLVNDRQSFGLHQSFDTTDTFDVNASETMSQNTFNRREVIYYDEYMKVVSLGDDACRSLNLVGGKARSLSMLKHFARFNVPNGICITTNAYREHITKNIKLKEVVDNISASLNNGVIAELQTACDEAEEVFRSTNISDELQKDVRSKLGTIYEDNAFNNVRFAVRSSGECEDGEQLSSAGQMETILSVRGFDNIVNAIRLCWASSVSYRVVEYRRQNGQSLVDDLGVVVQEMVDAEKAGILFTNDPVTGNESIMLINASYGLGEAVVSGQVNADTIIVKRDQNNKVLIDKLEGGNKLIRIVADKESGVKTEAVPEGERNQLCLTKDEIKTICDVGIEIENEFGSAQDIEWAMSKGKFAILQSRPITTLDIDTDTEIMQEFDIPVVNENLFFTTANVQEVLPGALTPLTGDIMLSAGSSAVMRSNDRSLYQRPVHPIRHILTFAGVPLLNMTCISMIVTLMMGENVKSDVETNLMGQKVDDHKLKTVKDFYGRPYPPLLKRFWIFLKSMIAAMNATAQFYACVEKANALKVGENSSNSKELYKAIDETLSLNNDIGYLFFLKSSTASIWINAVTDMLKRSGSSGTNSGITAMADVALILSECKDLNSSLDVPSALNRLAEVIAQSNLKEEFLETPDQDCDEFLKQSDNNEIQSQYQQFLLKHGHRSIRECELYMKSWKQDPVPLIKAVKQIIKRDKFEGRKENKSIDEIVNNLQTPLSHIKRTLLRKLLVRKARDGVREREIGKSAIIKANDIFKQAYWKLAKMMVKEGRLPDERLLFFLTHHEIGILLATKSVKMIRLAKRRFKLWPQMDKIKYSKLNFGLPKPIQENAMDKLESEFTLKGMPVCLGKVEGTARVVKFVENAGEIQEGEILICVFTDIGWSPYFCLIKGLVTELGGLISHGAVVARECGIPCVVNVANATDLIKTGDHVIIDGSAGTITKLEK